ncbi:MAG: hypothetical protein ACTSUC_17795, partial [Promethearchaeota archaeon]
MSISKEIWNIDELDHEKVKKRLKWGTLNYFWDLTAVKVIILLAALFYALLYFIPLRYQNTRTFIPS